MNNEKMYWDEGQTPAEPHRDDSAGIDGVSLQYSLPLGQQCFLSLQKMIYTGWEFYY